ncbi:hypothetical protein EON77_11605, partial [bacterium]
YLLAVDLSGGRGLSKEKLVVEGDEPVVLTDGQRARACDLRIGEHVTMEDGQVGDVLGLTRRAKPPAAATHATPGKPPPRRVLATSERVVTRLRHLRTAKSEVDTTDEHPFFVQGKGFTRAGDLRPGDLLATEDARTTVEVLATEARDVPPTPVFNLRVDESHTYYVSREGLLVHNAGGDAGPCNIPGLAKPPTEREIKELQADVRLRARRERTEAERVTPENYARILASLDTRDGRAFVAEYRTIKTHPFMSQAELTEFNRAYGRARARGRSPSDATTRALSFVYADQLKSVDGDLEDVEVRRRYAKDTTAVEADLERVFDGYNDAYIASRERGRGHIEAVEDARDAAHDVIDGLRGRAIKRLNPRDIQNEVDRIEDEVKAEQGYAVRRSGERRSPKSQRRYLDRRVDEELRLLRQSAKEQAASRRRLVDSANAKNEQARRTK